MAGARTDDPVQLRSATTAATPPQAWERITEACTPLPAETVPISEAAGRTLAETVWSTVALPRDTNSAMDGFGVRSADGPHHRAPIVGESRAGTPFSGDLPAGAVVRIATGGTVPAGVDAVVRVEDADVDGDRVTLPAAPLHDNIRFAGEDLAVGGQVVAAGTRLGAHHLVALAAAGVAAVSCRRRPIVSIVVTGELSVGRHDHTRPVLDALGVDLIVERLLLRPGQPTAIGVRRATGQLWFGLPGNPVSAFAIARLFLVPALHALSGAAPVGVVSSTRRLTAPARRDATRWLALRGTSSPEGVAVLQGQGSHMVAALAAADVLVLLEPGAGEAAPGEAVQVIALDAAWEQV